MAELHTGGINSPHEWDLSVCNKAEFAFWDKYLDGMAESNDYEICNHFKYRTPNNNQYYKGTFKLGSRHNENFSVGANNQPIRPIQ